MTTHEREFILLLKDAETCVFHGVVRGRELPATADRTKALEVANPFVDTVRAFYDKVADGKLEAVWAPYRRPYQAPALPANTGELRIMCTWVTEVMRLEGKKYGAEPAAAAIATLTALSFASDAALLSMALGTPSDAAPFYTILKQKDTP